MKKGVKIFTIALVIIFTIIGYRIHTEKQIQHYLKYFSNMTKEQRAYMEFKGEVNLDRVIKRSPTELIMIVKWGKDYAYIRIENWLTDFHDSMEILKFENKRMHIIE